MRLSSSRPSATAERHDMLTHGLGLFERLFARGIPELTERDVTMVLGVVPQLLDRCRQSEFFARQFSLLQNHPLIAALSTLHKLGDHVAVLEQRSALVAQSGASVTAYELWFQVIELISTPQPHGPPAGIVMPPNELKLQHIVSMAAGRMAECRTLPDGMAELLRALCPSQLRRLESEAEGYGSIILNEVIMNLRSILEHLGTLIGGRENRQHVIAQLIATLGPGMTFKKFMQRPATHEHLQHLTHLVEAIEVLYCSEPNQRLLELYNFLGKCEAIPGDDIEGFCAGYECAIANANDIRTLRKVANAMLKRIAGDTVMCEILKGIFGKEVFRMIMGVVHLEESLLWLDESIRNERRSPNLQDITEVLRAILIHSLGGHAADEQTIGAIALLTNVLGGEILQNAALEDMVANRFSDLEAIHAGILRENRSLHANLHELVSLIANQRPLAETEQVHRQLRRISEFEATIKEFEKTVATLKVKLDKARQETDESRALNQQFCERLAAVQKELGQKKAELIAANQFPLELQEKLAVLRGQKEESEKTVGMLTAQLEAAQAELAIQQNEFEQLTRKLTAMQRAHEDEVAKLERKRKKELNRAEQQRIREVGERDKTIAELMAALKQKDARVAELEDTIQRKNAQLASESKKHQDDQAASKAQIAESKKTISRLQAELMTTQTKFEQRNEAIAVLGQQIADLTRARTERDEMFKAEFQRQHCGFEAMLRQRDAEKDFEVAKLQKKLNSAEQMYVGRVVLGDFCKAVEFWKHMPQVGVDNLLTIISGAIGHICQEDGPMEMRLRKLAIVSGQTQDLATICAAMIIGIGQDRSGEMSAEQMMRNFANWSGSPSPKDPVPYLFKMCFARYLALARMLVYFPDEHHAMLESFIFGAQCALEDAETFEMAARVLRETLDAERALALPIDGAEHGQADGELPPPASSDDEVDDKDRTRSDRVSLV
jgi:hypothetical protein